MSVQSLSFKMCGKSMTDFYRERVLEGGYDSIFRALLEDYKGITVKQVDDLLEGKFMFSGIVDSDNDSFMYEKETRDITKYKDDLNYIYGNCVKIGTYIYKPVYKIVSISYEQYGDLMSDIEDYAKGHYFKNFRDDSFSMNDPLKEIIELQGELYCNGTNICSYIPKLNATVIFEKIDNYPKFMVPKNNLCDINDFNAKITFDPLEDESRDLSDKAIRKAYLKKQGDIKPLSNKYKGNTLDKVLASMKESEEAHEDIKNFKNKIIEQNDIGKYGYYEYDFGEIVLNDKIKLGKVKIPLGPLNAWAFNRTMKFFPVNKWENVCPMGMKMLVDDRNHTDWMVGAGIDLSFYNIQEFKDKQGKMLFELQKEKFGFEDISILVNNFNTKVVHGQTYFPKPNEACPEGSIAIIPNAGPDYLAALQSATAAITNRGGELSHLSTIAREKNYILVRLKDATKIFKDKQLIEIDLVSGNTTIELTGK